MSWSQRAYTAVCVLFAAGVAAQFYTMGLALFGAGISFAPHQGLGFVLVLVSLLMVGFALAARPHSRVGLCVLALALVVVQPMLALAPRPGAPALAALHAVIGGVIAVVAFLLVRRDE